MKLLGGPKARYTPIIWGFAMMAFAGELSAADPEQGVWQKHEYSFQFLGFTTTYSCKTLARISRRKP